jgi:predicted phage-related endonuclease
MLTEAQKALRRTGVGASECAAALGLSPYQTRF